MKKVDFSGVSLGYDPIPPGEYVARITGAEEGETGPNAKDPGAPKITWELTVSEGEHIGRKLFRVTTFSQKAKWVLMELLIATGKFDETALQGSGWDADTSALIGSEVKVQVSIDSSFDGNPRNQVKKISAITAEDLVGAKPKRGFKR